jgi:hypothetical protein
MFGKFRIVEKWIWVFFNTWKICHSTIPPPHGIVSWIREELKCKKKEFDCIFSLLFHFSIFSPFHSILFSFGYYSNTIPHFSTIPYLPNMPYDFMSISTTLFDFLISISKIKYKIYMRCIMVLYKIKNYFWFDIKFISRQFKWSI